MIVTSEEISQFRTQLADYPQALQALDEIEACEGDLQDAALVLAIKSGYEPDRAGLFNKLVERSRDILCQEDVQDNIMAGMLAGAVEMLLASTMVPPGLATPVVIYVFKRGIKEYCKTPEK
ncbi:MAG: hypothetical protein F6K24_46630 [Okeania sp. SIO2D1]|nr:hypothetical protein [Okeania sp. SIO2D1]